MLRSPVLCNARCISSTRPTLSSESQPEPGIDPPFLESLSSVVNGFLCKIQSWAGANVTLPDEAAEPVIREFGYHPFDLVGYTLNEISTGLGIPYWSSIIILTIGFRVALMPLSIKAKRDAIRLKPLTAELNQFLQRAKEENIPDNEKNAEIRLLMRKHQTNPLSSIFGMLTQMPVFLSMFFGLKQMPEFCPDYASGGTLWFENLSVPDPLFVLPVLNGVTFFALMHNSYKSVPEPKTQQEAVAKTVLTKVIPVVMVPIAATLPSGVIIYWITNGAFTQLVQNPLFKTQYFKDNYLALAPGVTEVVPDSPTSTQS